MILIQQSLISRAKDKTLSLSLSLSQESKTSLALSRVSPKFALKFYAGSFESHPAAECLTFVIEISLF